MGIYLNPSNIGFRKAINSEIYVDKTGLIGCVNKYINTLENCICVSRPRRFGKSIAAHMIAAYYSRGCDSKELFKGLKITEDVGFEEHLNKYNVIHLSVQDFWEMSEDIAALISNISKFILMELINENPDVQYFDNTNLMISLNNVFAVKQVPFIFIIDEWDCVFRVQKYNEAAQKKYLDFLRNLLKDKAYVALAYMTGILPIKKYGEHSALNMFAEISMTDTREYTEFTGFTEDEVSMLCERYHMSFDETKHWYDGYNLDGMSIYNPRSVVMSMTGKRFGNYWTQTETYEALKVYIQMDFDGLREKVQRLIAGEHVLIDTGSFQNDMKSFACADDVLSLLIHLGYLSFEYDTKTCFIPNAEVEEEFIRCIKDDSWKPVMNAIRHSDELMKMTILGDEEAVAKRIEMVHEENASILRYNDETSLSCVLALAYYSARKNYSMIREMPAGKGYADFVFLPNRSADVPAIIVELKCNHSAETALEQIKKKNYTKCLEQFQGEILLVGISYDKDTKEHFCKIEKVTK